MHYPRRTGSDLLVSMRLERLVLQHVRQLGNTGRLPPMLTRGVTRLERKRVDEEMESDDVSFCTGRVVHRC